MQALTWTRSEETDGYLRLQDTRRSGIGSILILVHSISIRRFLRLTMRRSHSDQVGAVMGNTTHTTCVTILQRFASSSECTGARCVFQNRLRNAPHLLITKPWIALSLDSDVDTNKELIAHGYSNLLAGLLGTVPNYLVYVNTLLCVS